MNQDYEKAVAILKQNKQDDMIDTLNSVNDETKNKLVKQILDINFEQLNRLYNETKEKPAILDNKLEHLNFVDEYKLSKKDKDNYISLGENVIKNNQYAVATMAGGQGTRLGHKGPKGTFELKVENGPKTLFQILAENLISANKKYGVTIPWYVMTSSENNDQTVKFFKDNKFFGYPEQSLKFFMQGDLPLLFRNGKLILDKDSTIKMASDGNGCVYKSMKQHGVLKDMESKGVKWVFIGSVDNALLNMVDPILVGLTIAEGNQIASKSIAKVDPTERVGVFCKANGVPSVIEYSELPEEMSVLRDKDGELLYGEAHIMCNLFTLDALKKVGDINLKYHVANKKSSYLDKNGKFVEVTEPNAYKFEAFIFDAFNYFDSISILRGKREFDFAPVKNKEGKDSPETAIKQYNEFWRK